MNRTILGFVAFGITLSSLAADEAKPPSVESIYDWTDLKAVPTDVADVEYRPVFSGPTHTLSELDVHFTTVKGRGASLHPPHRHPHEEMLIVDRGTIETLISGRWKKAGAGSVILIPPNVLHGVRNGGDTPLQYHAISWWTEKTDKSDRTDGGAP